MASQQVNDLLSKIYGGGYGGTEGYRGTVNQAYENLGQPRTDTARIVNGQIVGNREEVTNKFVTDLASTFADRVLQKTGSLPTEDQIRQYVASTATPGNAAKYVQGQLNPDIMNAQAEQYFQGNPDALTMPGTKSAEEQRILALNEQLDKIYNAGKQNLVTGYNEQVYGPAKQNLVNDLSAQGMLTQPNSRYSLNQLEANRGRDLQSGLNTLESNRATGALDLGKTIEQLLQENKNRAQNAYQFNQGFNANREDTAFNQGLQNRQLSIAQQIGRLQANQKKNPWSGAAGGALSGAGTGAAIGGAAGGIGAGPGALIGLLGGGLAGYFGNQ